MGNQKIFSIRNMLFGVVLVLVIGVLGFASSTVFEALHKRDQGLRMEFSNNVGDLLLASANNWAVERGVTNAALNGAGPARRKLSAKEGLKRTPLSKKRSKFSKPGTILKINPNLSNGPKRLLPIYKTRVAFRKSNWRFLNLNAIRPNPKAGFRPPQK